MVHNIQGTPTRRDREEHNTANDRALCDDSRVNLAPNGWRAVMSHESWRDLSRICNRCLLTERSAHEDYTCESWRAETDQPKQAILLRFAPSLAAQMSL